MAAVIKPFFNFDLVKTQTIAKVESGKIFFVSSEVRATNTLTFTVQPLTTETVTLDGKVYTFQGTLTNVDGHVHIGASLAASIISLKNAINLDGGVPGTDFALATTLHPTVDAGLDPTQLFARAKRTGISGNSITVSETVTGASWAATPTLLNGAPTPSNGDRDLIITLPQDDVDGGNYEFIFRDNGISKDSSNREYFTSWTIASGLTIPFEVTSSTRANNPYNSRAVLNTKGATLEGVKLGGRVNNGPGGTVFKYPAGESIKFISWGGVWYSTPPFGSGFYGLGDF